MVAGHATVTLNVLDRLMERASVALVRTRYHQARSLCRRALEQAFRRRDYDRMARIIMPLQEAARQIRQIALDEGECVLVGRRPRGKARTGCYLFQPPLVALDARTFRERADAAGVPVHVLCREPRTEKGLWPVAAVGPRGAGPCRPVIRAIVRPPRAVERVENAPTRDPGDVVPSAAWFEAAAEALGDAAIASVPGDLHPAWRVADLLQRLDAVPEHEKLHQRLEEACREAIVAGPPARLRARQDGDPNCF